MPAAEHDELAPPASFAVRGRVHGADVLIEDGARPLGDDAPLRAIWTPGHTPGHLCFADERYDVLLTGDHILPRISPNIGPSPLGPEDTLGTYLHSLSAMEELDPEEVLPAHEYRFTGLPGPRPPAAGPPPGPAGRGGRRRRRRRRLPPRSRSLSDSPGPVPGMSPGDSVRRSAIDETYAHLFHLKQRGRLTNAENPNDHWHVVPSGGVNITSS